MSQAATKTAYDLEERTARFGENVIAVSKLIGTTNITGPLERQMIRSATSIGANYMEANGASSKKDFTNKIFTCKKEAQETKHWLRMLQAAAPERTDQRKILWKEAHELTLIFHKITITARGAG